MKQFSYFIFSLILVSAGLSSCEDPIELDLGKPVEQIVIDAVINQTADTQFIYVSKSVAYLDNGAPKGYAVDSVGIVDTSTFQFHKFTHRGNGVYYFVPPSANTFQYGKDYQLLVRDGADTYVSQSHLNAPTVVDSFTTKYEDPGRFGGPKGNYVTLWAKDKKGKGDYYWFRLYRNDSLQARAGDISIAIDNAFNQDGNGDGELFIIPIRENFTRRPYKSGETAKIDILSITPEMYMYLNLIVTQLNNQGLFAVPPSNIPGNIFCINDPDKKVLGFFGMTGKVSTPTLLFQ
jgi:hypothetical protein